MALSVNITDEQNKELERLSKVFNMSKGAILRNLAFNNVKNLKVADYNLVFNELLQLNNNISQLLSYVKKEGAESAAESVFLLYEIKESLEDIKKKI